MPLPSSVLIVDDCATVRSFIKLMLTGEPEITTLLEAACAADVLRIVDSAPVDVITLDINMPGMDGLQLIRMLKLRSRSGIIVVSGNSDAHAQAMALGASACFEKIRLMPDRIDFIDSVVRAGADRRSLQ